MFRFGSFKGTLAGIKKYSITHCDEEDVEQEQNFDNDSPSLIEQADAAIEKDKARIKTPMQYENLRNVFGATSVGTYDGFRFAVQKQINLNTVVSHFYWVGSSIGQPIYQYRIILPLEDDKGVINVATDLDFNVEGDAKAGINENLTLKSSFANGNQQKYVTLEAELQDESSSAQLKYSRSAAEEFSVSFMQCIYPNLNLGGNGTYSMKNQALDTSVGFVYDPTDYLLAAQYDKELKLLYVRKVNPNRVHLGTELTVDAQGEAQMGVTAEFMLKQAKLHMGIDSNMLLKSYLESSLNAGTQMQLSAEMQQASNHYKFGFGIVMG